MAAWMSDTERKLREEDVADRDRLPEVRRGIDWTDAMGLNGGLEWKDGERELNCSDEAVKIHGATPACLTTVPYEDNEFDRGSDSEWDVPGGRKFELELSSVTKLGLDGAPMGSTLGLEYRTAGSSCSCVDLGDVGGSDTTALIVGVAVGKTSISSSEYSASEPPEA